MDYQAQVNTHLLFFDQCSGIPRATCPCSLPHLMDILEYINRNIIATCEIWLMSIPCNHFASALGAETTDCVISRAALSLSSWSEFVVQVGNWWSLRAGWFYCKDRAVAYQFRYPHAAAKLAFEKWTYIEGLWYVPSDPSNGILLSTWVGSKAPAKSWGFSEELTERAWLQLVRSCALHTCCCPNFW